MKEKDIRSIRLLKKAREDGTQSNDKYWPYLGGRTSILHYNKKEVEQDGQGHQEAWRWSGKKLYVLCNELYFLYKIKDEKGNILKGKRRFKQFIVSGSINWCEKYSGIAELCWGPTLRGNHNFKMALMTLLHYTALLK